MLVVSNEDALSDQAADAWSLTACSDADGNPVQKQERIYLAIWLTKGVMPEVGAAGTKLAISCSFFGR